jgi:rhodanese-related sulfurtransferase
MRRLFVWAAVLAISAACAFADGPPADIETYRDPDTLAQLIASGEPAHFLVDVRTAEEYAAGHIPTAINIPVSQIGEHPPTADKDALIIVYCASGGRSARSKARLEGLGYTRVVDFGGIFRWTGPTVTENAE